MRALRFADAPRRGPPPASAEEVARLSRRTGVVAALLVAWALGSFAATIASGRVGASALVLTGALPVALGALVLFALDRRAPSRALSTAAAASATLALAFAIAGHALFWGGISMRAMLPGTAGTIARVAILLLVPLYAGARLASLAWAWRASGSRARSPLLAVEAIARADDADLLARPAWRDAWRGVLARWGEGAALPGAILLDTALAARPLVDRLHADASADALADALTAQGALVERAGRELRVRFPDSPTLRLGFSRSLFPAGGTLDVRGDMDAARKLRRVLEGPASHALAFCWSAPALRWERRLNALHREALDASSLEERSIVMEELDRVRKALGERALAGAEAVILLLKEEGTRALLAHRMLSEPPGVRKSARVLAQHAALLPQVARVLDAGGLAAVRRVAFVPHWILPVTTPWGEQEIVVSAATARVDATESRALLAAMQRQGPVLLVDVGTSAVFLPAPPPTAALLRELRAAGLAVPESATTGETPPDVVYVPFLATAEGYVNGITGSAAPDLGNAVPVAPAA